MSKLSVVVVNHNTRELLRGCLRSLEEDGAGLSIQIVVVDNGSSDRSPEMVRREYPGVELREHSTNLGFSKAVNAGLRACASPCVLLLNSDTRACPGALRAMLSFMESHTDAGIVGPQLLNSDGSIQLSCGITPTVWTEICNKLLLHIPFPFFEMGNWAHDSVREVGWVSGACMLVRRTMLDQIDSLDESLFMYYEDLDLCQRARRRGWKIYYVPEGQVVHAGGASSKHNFEAMLIASTRSSFYFFRKHHGEGAAALLRLTTLPEMALRSTLWCAMGLLFPQRRCEARERLRAYRTILRRTLSDREYWRPA